MPVALHLAACHFVDSARPPCPSSWPHAIPVCGCDIRCLNRSLTSGLQALAAAASPPGSRVRASFRVRAGVSVRGEIVGSLATLVFVLMNAALSCPAPVAAVAGPAASLRQGRRPPAAQGSAGSAAGVRVPAVTRGRASVTGGPLPAVTGARVSTQAAFRGLPAGFAAGTWPRAVLTAAPRGRPHKSTSRTRRGRCRDIRCLAPGRTATRTWGPGLLLSDPSSRPISA